MRRRARETDNCIDCGASIAKRHGRARSCRRCGVARHLASARTGHMVKAAIRAGYLHPLDGSIYCVDCGATAEVYDHRDYSRPLVVEPVCRSCNCRRGPGAPVESEYLRRADEALERRRAWQRRWAPHLLETAA